MERPDASTALPIFVGIDPGSRIAGYAFMQARCHYPTLPKDFKVLDAGVLKVDEKLDYSERVGLLHDALYELAQMYKPTIFVLERAFADKNIASALRLGEVRGAFMAAAGRMSAQVRELAPTQVKKMLTGNGRANKEEVSRAIQALLGYDKGALPYDVTDALAIALSYGLGMSNNSILPGAARCRLKTI